MDEDSAKLEEEANRRKCAEQQPREPDVRLTWLKEERRCGEDGGSEEAEGEGHEYGDEEEGEKEGDGEDEKEEGERGEITDGKTENGEKREDGGKGEECGRGYGGVLKEREEGEEGEEMEEGEEGEEREEGEDGERGEPSVVEALREEVEMERILRALAEDGMKVRRIMERGYGGVRDGVNVKIDLPFFSSDRLSPALPRRLSLSSFLHAQAVEQQMERLRDEVSRYKGQHQRDTETVFQLQSSEWQALQEVQEEREQRRELETSLIYLHHTLLELLPPDLLTDPPVFHTYSHPPIIPPDLLSNFSETPSHLLTSDDHEDPCNPPMIPPGLLSNLSETPSHLLTTDGHAHPCDPSETSHKLPDLSKTPSQVVLPSDGHAYPSVPFETTQEPLDLPETPSSQAFAEDTGAGQRSPGGRVGLRGEGDGEEVHWVRESWLKVGGGERAGDGIERMGRGVGRRMGERMVGELRQGGRDGKEVASGTGAITGGVDRRREQQRMRCGQCEALEGAGVGAGRGGGARRRGGVDDGEKTAVQSDASRCVLGNVATPQPAVPRSTIPKSPLPESPLPESAISESALPKSAVPPSLVPVLLLARVACPCCQVEGLQWLCEGCGAKGRWDGARDGGAGYQVKGREEEREEEREAEREAEREKKREERGRDGQRERVEAKMGQVEEVRGEESGDESNKEIDRKAERVGVKSKKLQCEGVKGHMGAKGGKGGKGGEGEEGEEAVEGVKGGKRGKGGEGVKGRMGGGSRCRCDDCAGSYQACSSSEFHSGAAGAADDASPGGARTTDRM
ncbi:unnamed protein product [Closterium sp. Naga37s-1]|nr:unnamed protein product [Closterium sp. Naga37s-1]